MEIPDPSTQEGLAFLESHLETRSYISGCEISQNDLAVLKAIKKEPSAVTFPNVRRWYSHIKAADKKAVLESQEKIVLKIVNNVEDQVQCAR